MALEWHTVCHYRDAHVGFWWDCNGTALVPAPWFRLPLKGLLRTLEWQRSCHSRVLSRPLNGRIRECNIMLWLSMLWYDMIWYVMIWYDMIPEYLKINENQWKSMKINENQWNKLCYAMLKINENQWKSMNINENQWNKLCYAMLCYDAMTWWYVIW